MKKNGKFIFYIILGAVLLLAGCSTFMLKNWGSIRPDIDATTDFEKFQINANFNYYISGSDVYPTSILGLNNSYILDTDLWMKMESTPGKFTELVTNMKMRSLECGKMLHGFTVLDDKGKQIGIWYSLITGRIAVKMKEDRKVVIYPPREDDSYRSYEGKLGKGSGGM